MSWKGAIDSPDWRHSFVRGVQLAISVIVLTVLIYLTRNSVPELALTCYFLYAGPIVVASFYWRRSGGLLLTLVVVSLFVPVMLGTVADTGSGPSWFAGDLAVGVAELGASALLFVFLTIVAKRAGDHRRQKMRYQKLDRISERFSQELQVGELLHVILNQAVPLFEAAGGEIVLRNEQTDQLEMAAGVGVSQAARQFLPPLKQSQAKFPAWPIPSPSSDALAELILRQNKPFLHNDMLNDPHYVCAIGDTLPTGAQVHSVLAAPLRRGREPFGLLSLFNKANGGFNQSDLSFLTAIAEKSEIAIENARLYHRTDASLSRRVQELSILNRIARTLVSSLDLDQTIQTILDALQRLFPYAIAEVCLWEPVNRIMRIYAWSGEQGYAEATGGFYRLDEGYSGWIARHREQLWIPDVQARHDIRPKVDSADFPFRSYVGLPLQMGQQLIGTLEIVSYEPDAFSTSDQSMLEALCNQAAVAIHNARLYQERQQRLSEMVGLQQISQAIGSIRDIDQVYNVLTERIAQLMNVELCGVLLYDPEAQELVSRPPFYGVPSELLTAYRIPTPPGSPMWHIWQQAEYWYSNDVLADPLTIQTGLSALAAAAGVRATMFVVLAAGDRRLGIIQVSNKRDGSPFDDSDARLLSIFAHQTAVVVENARLYEVEQERHGMMDALQAGATAMSSALDLDEVVQVVVERAAVTFPADAVALIMLDSWPATRLRQSSVESEQHLVVEASVGLSDDFVAACRLQRDEIIDYVERHGAQPRLFDAQEIVGNLSLVKSESLSWITVAPLVSGGEALGVLHFYGKENARPFTADELELVALFANQAAIAVENARLYTQTDVRLGLRLNELTVLNRIGEELNATLDLEHILNLVLKEAVQATNATHGNVNLMNWETGDLEARATLGFTPKDSTQREINLTLGRGVISRAAQTAQPVVVDDVSLDPDYVAIVPGTRSELAVPILHRGVVLGVINLESPQVGSFTEIHTGFLETLAGQAAAAINNARIYAEQQERSELMRRRAEQLSYLFEIGQALRTNRPLEEMLTEVAFAVQETVGYNVALISVREGDRQRRVAGAGIPIVEFERMRQVLQPWADVAALFKQEFQISNSYYIPYERIRIVQHLDTLQLDESGFEREPGRWHPEDLLLVPLRGSGDTILGLLSVDQPRNNQVPDRTAVETLEIFAAQAALAVENARLVQDLTQRVDELTLLNEVGHSISARLDLEGLLETVVEAAAELLGAPRSILFLQDSSDDQLAFVPRCAQGYDLSQLQSLRFHSGEGLVGKVAETARAIIIPDARQDERFQPLIPTQAGIEKDSTSALGSSIGSIILVPLIFGGRVIGVFSVDHSQSHAFSNADITSLSTLADQAAIAAENASLFEQSQRQLLDMTVINEIGHALSETVHLDELLAVLRQQVSRLVPTDSFYVALYDQQAHQISFPLFLRHDEPVSIDPIPASEGLTGHIIRTKQSLLLAANAQQSLQKLGLPWHGNPTRSYLGVPMLLGDEAVGVIAVQDFERDYVFDSGHERALALVAVQAAIAIQNARLFEEVGSYRDELEQRVEERTAALENERDRVESLYRITSELSASLDLDRVLNRALSLVLDAVEADRSSVFMLDPQIDRIVHRAALWSEATDQSTHLPIGGTPTSFRRGEGLAGWVIQNKQPAIIDDLHKDPRWVELDDYKRLYHSILAVPLVASNEAMGSLLLYHSERAYFTPDHLRLVEAVAAQVASAINNSQLYGYVRDSADRLGRMIKSQQEETAKTEAILEGVADGVMVSDSRGVVIRFNAAAERILNTPREQVLGRSTNELLGLYGTSAAVWAEAIDRWRDSPPQAEQEALFAERLEFEGRIVSVLLSPLTSRFEFLGTISLFRDITQQVEVEHAKSEFVSTVSHELRTPMTSIKGYADLLVMGAAGALNEGQQRFLSIIKTNADRLTMLVNDLLDIGRIDTRRVGLNLAEMKLSPVVQIVIDSLHGKARERKQTLETDFPADLPPVFADRDRLIQILTNLVSNAQQYTPTGGHVTVTARPCFWDGDSSTALAIALSDDKESAIEIEEIEPNMVQVSVTDDGIGIASEDQEKIFERFFRSDHPLVQETAGTGLGLAITNSLVEMQDGKLWVESQVGQGSTFNFTLPIAVKVKAKPQPQPQQRHRKS